jgi:hypothetical protein
MAKWKAITQKAYRNSYISEMQTMTPEEKFQFIIEQRNDIRLYYNDGWNENKLYDYKNWKLDVHNQSKVIQELYMKILDEL